jgi:hypothetical protein
MALGAEKLLMNIVKYSTAKLALVSGALAALIGLITFTLSWNLWDAIGGPLPGYKVLLFPANLTLVYIWHPLFTEELAFWPKLCLMLVGQFTLVACFVACIVGIKRRS